MSVGQTLYRACIAAGSHILLTLVRDRLIAPRIQFRVVLSQPQIVVGVIHTKVIGQFHVLEAPVGARFAQGRHAIFVKSSPEPSQGSKCALPKIAVR